MGLEEPPAQESAEQQSTQGPPAQPRQNGPASEEPADEEPAHGALLVVEIILVVLAERPGDARLERLFESGLDLFHLVLTGELGAVLLRELVPLPRLVDLLDLDDVAGRGADRQHHLLGLLVLSQAPRFSSRTWSLSRARAFDGFVHWYDLLSREKQ